MIPGRERQERKLQPVESLDMVLDMAGFEHPPPPPGIDSLDSLHVQSVANWEGLTYTDVISHQGL